MNKSSDFIRSSSSFAFLASEPHRRRSCFCILPATALFCLLLVIRSILTIPDYEEKHTTWIPTSGLQDMEINPCQNQTRSVESKTLPQSVVSKNSNLQHIETNSCLNETKPTGSEGLPQGIITKTSNLEMRPLWGSPPKKEETPLVSLFAAAVGIKQKDLVDKMIRKFLVSDFVVMLFHYDGKVNDWRDFEWNDQVLHVSAANQTKWWFAKRFLHPDIVAEYSYIFLWDEDLGVQYFDPSRYLSIVQSEGLEISQPALDTSKSVEVHHQITVRGRRTTVHRRTYKGGRAKRHCDAKSTGPPCTGWIEMMAPVFSRNAWRCVWYLIQNDLIHAWGLDVQLGYCAQGDRTVNIGVVDAEYIIHYGRPTLGGIDKNEALSVSPPKDHRLEVRRESYKEFKVFRRRWNKAVTEDKCFVDRYPSSLDMIP